MTENHTHTTDHEPTEALVSVYVHTAPGYGGTRVVITPESSADGESTYALDSYGVPLADVALALECCLAAVNEQLAAEAEAEA